MAEMGCRDFHERAKNLSGWEWVGWRDEKRPSFREKIQSLHELRTAMARHPEGITSGDAEWLNFYARDAAEKNIAYSPQLYIAFQPVRGSRLPEGFKEEYDTFTFTEVCYTHALSINACAQDSCQQRDRLEAFNRFLSDVADLAVSTKQENGRDFYSNTVKLHKKEAEEIVQMIAPDSEPLTSQSRECLLNLMRHISDRTLLTKIHDRFAKRAEGLKEPTRNVICYGPAADDYSERREQLERAKHCLAANLKKEQRDLSEAHPQPIRPAGREDFMLFKNET